MNENEAGTSQANGAMVTATAGTSTTEAFGSTSMVRHAETAAAAVAAQARAAVESRYIVAMKRPRDMDAVRLTVLKECRRPGFAAVARYRKPVGDGIEGPSIRFAEAAIRAMTNMLQEVATIYEDPEKRIMRVTVSDLETNTTYFGDVTIEKTVERSKLKEGQTPISVRMNSVGKATYLVTATEDDLLNKQGALVSKQLRTLALRVIPGDIVEEAMAEVILTLEKEDAKDPALARKKLVDAFDALGVRPSDLRDYLGHEVATITPPELAELRAVGASIRDGEATWKDSLEHKLRTSKATAPDAPVQTVAERVKQQAAATKGKATPAHDADGVITEDKPAPAAAASSVAVKQGRAAARQPGED